MLGLPRSTRITEMEEHPRDLLLRSASETSTIARASFPFLPLTLCPRLSSASRTAFRPTRLKGL